MESSESINYNDAIEALLKSIGEKALSLNWLHSQSEKRYNQLNNILAIPSIILSTTVATVGSVFAGSSAASYASSVVSIVVSVLSTLNSYFLFAKRAEAHRITAISYSKLYLQISIELSLPREKRMSVKAFLKSVSEQIQRLNEIQPGVPQHVIEMYKKTFHDYIGKDISIPEQCNGLVDIKVYQIEEVAAPVAPEGPSVPEEGPKEPKKKPAFR